MQNNFLSFLGSGLTLAEVDAKKTRPKISVNNNPVPTFLGFRLWYDGSVFPSQALVDQLKLEYPKATITTEPYLKEGKQVFVLKGKEVPEGTEGAVPKVKKSFEYAEEAYGLDVIDSAEWTQYPQNAPRGLLVAVVKKTEPKVDLFSGVRYNDDGTPLTSVMTQGSDTFGKTIIALCNELYGVILGNGEGEVPYIDFRVETGFDVASIVKNGIFLIPKKIVRGEEKGKNDYERRENISIFGLEAVPAEKNAPVSSEEAVVSAEENA